MYREKKEIWYDWFGDGQKSVPNVFDYDYLDVRLPFIISLIAFAVGLFVFGQLLFAIPLLPSQYSFGTSLWGWVAYCGYVFNVFHTDMGIAFYKYLHDAATLEIIASGVRICLTFSFATVLAAYMFKWMAKPVQLVHQLSGKVLVKDPDDVQEIMGMCLREESNPRDRFIELIDGCRLSIDGRAGEHTLIVGGTGSGKSVCLDKWVNNIFKLDQRMILTDWKGEWTARYNGIIFNVYDRRSVRWAIGKDIVSVDQANGLAEALITKSSDSDGVWVDWGRAVMAGLIIKQQHLKKEEWTCQDLINEAGKISDPAYGKEIVMTFNPSRASVVNAPENQWQSIISMVDLGFKTIAKFAECDMVCKDNPTFSISEWLSPKYKGKRQVFLGGNTNVMDQSRLVMGIILRVVGGKINARIEGDKNNKPVWIIADEFPMIGKLEILTTLVQFARSKGAKVILIAQDYNQIVDSYGAEKAASLFGMIGTRIFGRTELSKGNTEICEKGFGHKEIIYYTFSVGDNGKTNKSKKTERKLVVQPDELALVGKEKGGVVVYIDGISHKPRDGKDEDVKYIFKTFISFPETKEFRAGQEIYDNTHEDLLRYKKELYGDEALEIKKPEIEITQEKELTVEDVQRMFS